MIFRHRDGEQVEGLTTTASLLFTGAIGAAVGTVAAGYRRRRNTACIDCVARADATGRTDEVTPRAQVRALLASSRSW